MTATVAIIMVFLLAIIAILTDYYHKQSKIKLEIIQHELALEKRKYENHLIENGKKTLELEKNRE